MYLPVSTVFVDRGFEYGRVVGNNTQSGILKFDGRSITMPCPHF